MRTVMVWTTMLFALLTAAACTDGPTVPVAVSPEAVQHVGVECASIAADGTCVLDPVTSDPQAPSCDVWWSPDCGMCETSTGIGDPDDIQANSACPGGGGGSTDPGDGSDPVGGGGGGGTPPPACPDYDPTCAGSPTEPPPADTCNTGDPIVDDPQVSDGLEDLWAQSNPDANLYQRVEKAGWIIQTASGYSIVPIATSSASFGCANPAAYECQ